MTDRDFTIDEESGRAALRGVMRLESVEAYDRVFAPLRAALESSPEYTLDVRDLLFLNSSGIRALGELVLRARDKKIPLRIVASSSVPWQRKTFASLAKIHAGLDVEYAGR